MAIIPKLVHLTYISEELIPEHWQEAINAWKQFGWIVYFHSDEENNEIVSKYYPEYLQKYNSFKYKIQQIDFVRLCYLDKWGGVYADLDIVPLEDVYKLLQYPCTVLKNPYGHVYFTNMFMAGEHNHPFWKYYMDQMTTNAPWWAIGKHLHVMSTTGPFQISKCIKEFQGDIHMLPDTWIQNSICNLSMIKDSKLKAVRGQSWNEWDSHIYNFFICRYILFQIMIALILLVVIIYII